MKSFTDLFTTSSPFWTSTLLSSLVIVLASQPWRDWQKALARGLVPIILVQILRIGLDLILAVTPRTIDAELYSSEAALGFPTFAIRSILDLHPWLSKVCETCYWQLPVAAALTWGLTKSSADFRLYATLGVAGSFGFLLMPAVGPAGVNPSFPGHPDALLSAPPSLWRNCMPSLHAAWLLALWWSSSALSRWWRTAYAVFGLLSLVWTLGCGYHYAVDVVVALPFAYGVRAAMQRDLRALYHGFLVAGWFVVLRLGSLIHHPALGWVSVIATIVSCVAVGRKVSRRIGDRNYSAPSPPPSVVRL